MKKLPTSYIVIPVIALLSSVVYPYFLSHNIEWYFSLKNPCLTAPSWLNDLMWKVVYALAALAGILAWQGLKRDRRFSAIFACLIATTVVNVVYVYALFQLHAFGLTVLAGELITALVVATIALLWKPMRTAAYCLLPLAALMAFTTYHICSVWHLNQVAGMVDYFKWW